VTAIAVVSAIVLAKDDAAGANPLRVDVVAQQFAWSFYYGCDANAAEPTNCKKHSDVLRLPVDRSIVLHMTSKDVVHSFWVPEFSQKQDLVPGIHPTLHVTPTRVGTYPVVCTGLCGLGHALMRSQTVVCEPAVFEKWASSKTAAGRPGCNPRKPRRRRPPPRTPATSTKGPTPARRTAGVGSSGPASSARPGWSRSSSGSAARSSS